MLSPSFAYFAVSCDTHALRFFTFPKAINSVPPSLHHAVKYLSNYHISSVEAVPLARRALQASLLHAAQKAKPSVSAATTSSATSTLALASSSPSLSDEIDTAATALSALTTTEEVSPSSSSPTAASPAAGPESDWAPHERTPEVIRAAKLVGACLLQASKASAHMSMF
jgi:hypothetical protein